MWLTFGYVWQAEALNAFVLGFHFKGVPQRIVFGKKKRLE